MGDGRSGELRYGRFLANRRVTQQAIVASWGEHTTAAAVGRHVLCLQDTTAITFATGGKAASARGGAERRKLGHLNQGNAHGILAHVMMGVDADSGACLGLTGGHIWTRTGKPSQKLRDRPLSKRESRRWLETAHQAADLLQSARVRTVVSDREGDLYPLWARPKTAASTRWAG